MVKESTRHTCVADARVIDFDANLMSLGRLHLDVLDRQVLACFPRDCGLRIRMSNPHHTSSDPWKEHGREAVMTIFGDRVEGGFLPCK